jgi:undecaprenyl-diphosphatase
MTIIQSIILGIVQGLTELLPISSSAHLFLIPWLFDWPISESFDVALHFGTLLAIGIFFFKDWIILIKGAYRNVIHKEKSIEGRLFFYLVLATIPGGIMGFILDKYAAEYLMIPTIIAIALILMGIILYLIDKNSKSVTKYNDLNLKQTFLIGLSQALAFIPGVSRSGITMVTARSLGVERESAAKFSFMLSAPIVLAATLYKFKDFSFDLPFIIGVLTSFAVGILVIKFLLNYLKKSSFKVFAFYRVVIGVITLIAIFLIK